jgi:hypothetical protein
MQNALIKAKNVTIADLKMKLEMAQKKNREGSRQLIRIDDLQAQVIAQQQQL